jgi:trehalose 6-phosphate synthase
MVRPFPISIDYDWHTATASQPEVDRGMEIWRKRIGKTPEFLGIGIDRIDYTKGIPERLSALDLFFRSHPEYVGRLVFLQIGVPSRVQIQQYKDLNSELDSQVRELNLRWGTGDYQPVVFCRGDYSQTELMSLHRLAQFCIVSSLHDGMNLVAKEFVASRFDEDGVLILSTFAGAARELTHALLVNPFSTDEISDAIYRALTMSAEERSKHMQRMRAAIAENNVYRWAGKILSTLLKVDIPETAPDAENRRDWEAAGVLR